MQDSEELELSCRRRCADVSLSQCNKGELHESKIVVVERSSLQSNVPAAQDYCAGEVRR